MMTESINIVKKHFTEDNKILFETLTIISTYFLSCSYNGNVMSGNIKYEEFDETKEYSKTEHDFINAAKNERIEIVNFLFDQITDESVINRTFESLIKGNKKDIIKAFLVKTINLN